MPRSASPLALSIPRPKEVLTAEEFEERKRRRAEAARRRYAAKQGDARAARLAQKRATYHQQC